MRGLRSTIALVVVLGGLFAYIYFVTWKQPTEPASKLEKVFAGLQADKIEELTITSDKGDVTALKKDSGGWSVVKPISARADQTEATAITSALGQVEVARVIDENPTSLTDFGLEKPRIVVEFKSPDDKSFRRLVLGEKSPTGSDLFTRRNDDKRVFLISSSQESTFNKSTFDLRDKTVLKFERDKVEGLDVRAGAKRLQFTKDGSDWKLTQPVQARADYGAVEGLLGRLQSAAMKSMASEEATTADLKKYGLDKPEASVEIKVGSARATLQIGSKAENSAVYARDASKNAVVTIDGSLAEDLKKGSDDYRRKDVFEFRAYNVDRLEVTRSGQTVTFEKVKAPGNEPSDKWRRSAPTAGDVAKDKIDSLLSRLSNMRMTSFVDASAKTGLNQPAMTVAAKFEDGKKEEKIAFGKVDADVFASRPGEPGAGKIDPTDFTEATKALDELSK